MFWKKITHSDKIKYYIYMELHSETMTINLLQESGDHLILQDKYFIDDAKNVDFQLKRFIFEKHKLRAISGAIVSLSYVDVFTKVISFPLHSLDEHNVNDIRQYLFTHYQIKAEDYIIDYRTIGHTADAINNNVQIYLTKLTTVEYWLQLLKECSLTNCVITAHSDIMQRYLNVLLSKKGLQDSHALVIYLRNKQAYAYIKQKDDCIFFHYLAVEIKINHSELLTIINYFLGYYADTMSDLDTINTILVIANRENLSSFQTESHDIIVTDDKLDNEDFYGCLISHD